MSWRENAVFLILVVKMPPIFLAKFPKLSVILILLEILQLHKIDRDTTAKRPLNERVLLKVAILIAEEFNLETLINVIPRI